MISVSYNHIHSFCVVSYLRQEVIMDVFVKAEEGTDFVHISLGVVLVNPYAAQS